jgi:two-component system phosphate regulon response regulator PhoB
MSDWTRLRRNGADVNTLRLHAPGVLERMRSGSRGTVLIIDDDAWIRSVIAELLIDADFSVEQAADSATGFSLAEQVQPDVILLDLALPMHSGLEVLQRMKEHHPTREIPVIIVSAYAMLLVRDKAARADGLLQQPIDLKELLNKVNQVVRGADPRFRLLPPTSSA